MQFRQAGEARRIASRMCDQYGISFTGLRRLNEGSPNAIFAIENTDRVLRIAPPLTTFRELDTTLNVVQLLIEHGAPYVAPSPPAQVATDDAGNFATFWPYVNLEPFDSRMTTQDDWRSAGAAVSQLHEAGRAILPSLESSGISLPTPTDADGLHRRLTRIPAANMTIGRRKALDSVITFLGDHEALNRKAQSPLTVVTGELWPKNVVMTSNGVQFVDIDYLGVAPAVYDLATIRAAVRRGRMTPDQAVAFEEGYGHALPEGVEALWHETAALTNWALWCAERASIHPDVDHRVDIDLGRLVELEQQFLVSAEHLGVSSSQALEGLT